MSKVKTLPKYASEMPYVPVNWQDRDTITRRICDILEAVMPEGNQLEKTKELVKETTKQYWITLFNDQFDSFHSGGLIGFTYDRELIAKAIWERWLEYREKHPPQVESSTN